MIRINTFLLSLLIAAGVIFWGFYSEDAYFFNGSSISSDNSQLTFTVSGNVSFKDNGMPVTSGMVKAVKPLPVNGQLIILDSAYIQPDGSYILTKVPSDSMDIMAYQDDDIDCIPTFHDSTIYWQCIKTIYPVSPMSGVNLSVSRLVKSPGHYSISGIVYYNNNSPLSGARVYLMSGSIFRNSDITNSNGFFMMDSLESGLYMLMVNMQGFYSRIRQVNLTDFNRDTITISLNDINGFSSQSFELPGSFMLYQNYPNPFNPTTKIRFDIPAFSPLPSGKGQGVRFIVYNSLGQLVETLAGQQLHPGSYEIEFDGTNYPSGIYFYKLYSISGSNEYSQTKKMILLR